MYRVIIADDDYLTRTSIRKHLDKIMLDVLVCGEAENGREALTLVDKENPDIIISDIRMPVMDGVALSLELKSRMLDNALIILSNYDDFEYVSETLKNGAVDYLLKHRLSPEVLENAMKRAAEFLLDKKQSQTVHDKYQMNYMKNLTAIKQNFVRQVLSGSYHSENEILKEIELLELKISTKNVIVAVMEIDHYSQLLEQNRFKSGLALKNSCQKVLEDILNYFNCGAYCNTSDGSFAILLSYSSYRSMSAINSSVYKLLTTIQNNMNKLLNLSVSISYSNLYTSIMNIPEAYIQVNESLLAKFTHGCNRIIRGQNTIPDTNSILNLNTEIENSMLSCIEKIDQPQLMITLEKIFNKIKYDHLSFTSCQGIFNELLAILNRLCRKNDIDIKQIHPDNRSPYDAINKSETLADVQQYIIFLFRKLMEQLEARNKNFYSHYILSIISFINVNYMKNITLQDAAEHIGINFTYLSKIFKQEVGIGFSEYLSEVRIEKAKILLDERNANIKQIVDLCGFNDYDYFFKVFKRKLGITPKEYQKKHRVI